MKFCQQGGSCSDGVCSPEPEPFFFWTRNKGTLRKGFSPLLFPTHLTGHTSLDSVVHCRLHIADKMRTCRVQGTQRKLVILAWLGAIGCLSLSSLTSAFVMHPHGPCCTRPTGLLLSHLQEDDDTTNDDEEVTSPRKNVFASICSAWVPKHAMKSLVTLGVACSLAMPAFASDSSSLLVGQRYWTIMNEGACHYG